MADLFSTDQRWSWAGLIFGNMVIPIERKSQRQIQRQGMADPVSHGALQVLKRTAKKDNRTI